MKNLLPEQCRAARGLLNWTQEQLAVEAGVSRSTVKDFECGRHELHRATELSLMQTFEGAGVVLYCNERELGICLRKQPDHNSVIPDCRRDNEAASTASILKYRYRN